MAEPSTKLLVLNSVLLAGVLVATAMVTCSNDRLEDQVVKLRKAVETGAVTTQAPGMSPAPGSAAPADSDAPERTPGAPSPVTVFGWGGRKAAVTYVEGAVPGAPLTLVQKPRPQNDWYVMRWPSAAKTLNYYTTNEGECTQIVRYILGHLFLIDPDQPPAVIPSLATRWEVSDDKLTYTYHLRRGVQFADGRPFTSADVKFSFDVVRDAEVNAAHLQPSFEDVAEVLTPDPHTVVVKYKRRYWRGLYAVGFNLRVLNKGWYEEQIPLEARRHGIERWSTQPGQPGFGEVFRKMRMPCPGTGPYYIVSEEDYTQDRVVLTQNPFYYGIQVHPTWYNFVKLRRLYIRDDVAADEAFRKQEFDVMSVDHERWDLQLKDDPTVTSISNHYLYDHIGLDTAYFCWNCRRPPFDDRRVRVAMTHLTDREWILRDLYRGNGTIAVCKSKRSYPTYSNDLVPHPFDPEKARALLAEAGWRDTDGDGVLDRDGKRFEFVVKASSGGGAFGERVAGALKDACRKVGIRMDYQTSEWSTFIGDFEERRFDAAFLGSSWGDPWIDNYESYHSSQDVPAGGNASGWRNARADELLEAMRQEFDEAKRTEMFHEFNRIFYDEQPETLLVHPLVSVVQHKRFEGVKIRPTGLQPLDMWVKPENVLHR